MPLTLDRDDLIQLRSVAARLTIRFGAEQNVTKAFQAFYEAVKCGVKLARENTRPEPVVALTGEARRGRHATTEALDYEQTLSTYRQLADIRFKLLAFVPTLRAERG